MNILEKIIANTQQVVERRKKNISVETLAASAFFQRHPPSLSQSLLDPHKTGIIAEFKRQSPSKGIINADANLITTAQSYTNNGASGISVLTDTLFFGGKLEDLKQAAETVQLPLLRKDFIIDTYQIIEAKAYGASAILLIAANLSVEAVKKLSIFAQNLGLEVLLEIHNKEELVYIQPNIQLVGVNNRNLKTFQVDIQTSLDLIKHIPIDKIAISESGIDTIATIETLKNVGYKGFLIGEQFMKTTNPAKAFKDFVAELSSQKTI